MADRREIDEIRERVNILDVVQDYVALKKNGSKYKGLCPFHNEKTPSFNVDPDLGYWRCFGQCGEGGDIFSFVQKVENLSFAEALERLALRANVTLTRTQPSGAGAAPVSDVKERLYKVNSAALAYFRGALKRSETAGAYVADRGISEAARDKFSLGYAEDSWDGLTSALTAKKVSLADAELAGLVAKNDRGGYYDRLRGRVIFPILDVQERPIAFGGRVMGQAAEGQPKYWNSPETPVFSKSRNLYGLWLARKTISDSGVAVIVEGYTDVIAAHQAGFANVVATLGTSLTEEHVKVLSRLAKSVVLAFDADSAGLKAAYKAGDIFEAHEMEVRVLSLPDGEDPDSLLRKGRRDVFQQAIERASPLIEYRLAKLVESSPIESDEDRVALFRKAVPILCGIKSVIERERYVRTLAPYHPGFASGAAIAEDQIRQEVERVRRERARGAQPRADEPAPVRRGAAISTSSEVAERNLLRALISGDPSLANLVLAGIMPEEFPSGPARGLARVLYEFQRASQSLDPARMMSSVTDQDQVNFVTELAMEQAEPLTIQAIEDSMRRLRDKTDRAGLVELRQLINTGQATIEQIREYQRLNTKLKGSGGAAEDVA